MNKKNLRKITWNEWQLKLTHPVSCPDQQILIIFWFAFFLSGTSNDSWTGGSIVSQLNPDILKKIRNCFQVKSTAQLKKAAKLNVSLQDLQPQVKLKLLLSFLHIGRRNLEQWRPQLEAILEVYNTWWNLARFQYFHTWLIDRNRIWLNVQVALEDSEPWVSMLADLMGTFPSTGQLNTEVSTPDSNRWGPSYWKNFLWPFQQMSGKSTAICWLSLERHWRSTVTRMTMCCHWSATFWTRMLSSLWLVTSLNLANTLVSRGNQRLLLSRLIWWPGEPISHIALIRILGWIFSLVFSFRSVEAATKVKSQPASFPQRIRTMPKKLSDTTPLKVSEH